MLATSSRATSHALAHQLGPSGGPLLGKGSHGSWRLPQGATAACVIQHLPREGSGLGRLARPGSQKVVRTTEDRGGVPGGCRSLPRHALCWLSPPTPQPPSQGPGAACPDADCPAMIQYWFRVQFVSVCLHLVGGPILATTAHSLQGPMCPRSIKEPRLGSRPCMAPVPPHPRTNTDPYGPHCPGAPCLAADMLAGSPLRGGMSLTRPHQHPHVRASPVPPLLTATNQKHPCVLRPSREGGSSTIILHLWIRMQVVEGGRRHGTGRGAAAGGAIRSPFTSPVVFKPLISTTRGLLCRSC